MEQYEKTKVELLGGKLLLGASEDHPWLLPCGLGKNAFIYSLNGKHIIQDQDKELKYEYLEANADFRSGESIIGAVATGLGLKKALWRGMRDFTPGAYERKGSSIVIFKEPVENPRYAYVVYRVYEANPICTANVKNVVELIILTRWFHIGLTWMDNIEALIKRAEYKANKIDRETSVFKEYMDDIKRLSPLRK
jgi:hypothetical protein